MWIGSAKASVRSTDVGAVNDAALAASVVVAAAGEDVAGGASAAMAGAASAGAGLAVAEATRTGAGYWQATASGEVLAFGDAPVLGNPSSLSQPIVGIGRMETLVAESLRQPRFGTLLLSVFAGVALALASVGIYGLVSYSVAQRTREVGIRLALGAGAGSVLRLVLGQGMVLVGVGVAVGLAIAFGLARFLSSLLYEVPASDPATSISERPVPAIMRPISASRTPGRTPIAATGSPSSIDPSMSAGERRRRVQATGGRACCSSIIPAMTASMSSRWTGARSRTSSAIT